MFRLMIQKLMQKKWMATCILVGNILLIAVLSSQAMYKSAALQRMLEGEFKHFEQENNTWPLTMNMELRYAKSTQDKLDKANAYIDSLPEALDLEKQELIKKYSIAHVSERSAVSRDDSVSRKTQIKSITNLEDHVTIISGDMYQSSKDGVIDVIVNENTFLKNNYILGEELIFDAVKLPDDKSLRVRIVGVFSPNDENETFWSESPAAYRSELYMSTEDFESHFLGDAMENNTINVSWNQQLDYTTLKTTHISSFQKALEKTVAEGAYRDYVNCIGSSEVVDSYQNKAKRIDATLSILIVPVVILLCAFLFMISGQMLSMEQSEISVMKSRGASKRQILIMYFYQSVFLALIGILFGLPLGRLVCMALGSSTAFLEFGETTMLRVTPTASLAIYCLIAVALTIVFTLIPVFKYSGVGIVHMKQRKGGSGKQLWEKFYLDILLLAVSLYGYYSFSKSMKNVTENVITGQSMDPLLYVSSSVFILGAGLLLIRLQPYLIKLIYWIGKKFWKPASYVAFLQSIRTGKKQQFIMIFLILTVALGIFNATVARTIIANAEENKTYLDGVDLVVQEKWRNNKPAYYYNPTAHPLTYFEPDYSKYADADWIESSTKVSVDTQAKTTFSSVDRCQVTLMGIHTKEFGEMCYFDRMLNSEDFYVLLNKMAVDPRGIIVSSNFKTDFDLKEGDTLHYSDMDDTDSYGKIVGFVDYWPNYVSQTYSLDANGEAMVTPNYLIVANIKQLQEDTRVTPYQVWINVKDNTDPFYDWVNENAVNITSYRDLSQDLKSIRTDTLFQGTNGILTMSFIVILLLCGVGFLIFWIMSIRSREMMFGVLRAMGLRKNEIFTMLIAEQIFSSLYSIIAGAGIGFLSAKMFVPMIQTAYAGADQVLPLELIMDATDWARLFVVIVGMLVICLAVLLRMIVKSNISGALKLGED